MSETKRAPSNLVIRVATALVALPPILFLLFRGPAWGFLLLVLPVAFLGGQELFAMTHREDKLSQWVGALLTTAAMCVFYFANSEPRALATLLALLPALGPLWTLARLGDIKTAALRSLSMAATPLIVGVPLALLVVVRRDFGAIYVVFALAFAWGSDTGGYFGGRFFGKHKLYEAVSPKKTVEGAVGGLFGAAIMSTLFHVLFHPTISLVHLWILAMVAAALGQAGDLAESLLKRSAGVKDSGVLIPGHGGVLDRIDALLLTAVATYVDRLWFASDALR